MLKKTYVEVNGEKKARCPICGGPCTISSWEKNKMCISCNKLVRKGHTKDEIKRIRALQESTEAILDGEEEDTPVDTVVLDNLPDYDFRKKSPAGIEIFLSEEYEKQEARFLRDIYIGLYREYGTLGNFNNLIANILQSKLDLYRNSRRLSENLNPIEKKGIQESNVKLSSQINLEMKMLEDIKANFGSQSMNVVTDEFSKMLRYHHENDQEYVGIGICDTCKKRVFFKTNFTTFRAYYMDELITIRDLALKDETLDKKTIAFFIRNIEKVLNDNALVDTYVVKHSRELEAALQ